jgi:ankyrin repeat protein
LKASPYRGGEEDLVTVVKLLLDAGADVNARDKQGNSPLVLGLKHPNMEVVRLFKTVSQKDRQSTPPPSPPEEESTK